MGWIEIVLMASVVVNIILGYYSSIVAKRLYLAATNLEALESVIFSFSQHVKSIHEMEMFYGDQTLQSLIDHSSMVLEELDVYEDIMGVLVEEEQEGEIIEEEEV